jgi:hypothetical protein
LKAARQTSRQAERQEQFMEQFPQFVKPFPMRGPMVGLAEAFGKLPSIKTTVFSGIRGEPGFCLASIGCPGLFWG